MIREIVLYPYKIDKEGTIHIRAMVKSRSKEYRAKMKKLIAIGVFNKEVLDIIVGDKINV